MTCPQDDIPAILGAARGTGVVVVALKLGDLLDDVAAVEVRDLPQWMTNGRAGVTAPAREIARRVAAAQPTKAGRVPGWVRRAVRAELVGWARGVADTCAHRADPQYATDAVAAAWRPGAIACTACVGDLLRPPDGEDRCNGCRRVTAGPGDPVTAVSVVVENGIVFLVLVCAGCWWWA